MNEKHFCLKKSVHTYGHHMICRHDRQVVADSLVAYELQVVWLKEATNDIPITRITQKLSSTLERRLPHSSVVSPRPSAILRQEKMKMKPYGRMHLY